MESGTTLIQELHPLAIVVSGKRDRANGRYTDVLVRTDDGCRLLAWLSLVAWGASIGAK